MAVIFPSLSASGRAWRRMRQSLALIVVASVLVSGCFGRNETDPFAVVCGRDVEPGVAAFGESDRQFVERVPLLGNNEFESDTVWIGVRSDFDDVVAVVTDVMGLAIVSETQGATVATCAYDGGDLAVDVFVGDALSVPVRRRFDDNGWMHDDWTYVAFRAAR